MGTARQSISEGHDNGAVHIVVPETIFPLGSKNSQIEECRHMWNNSASLDLYYQYVWYVTASIY